MAFIPLAIAGLSALGGALGNRSQTTNQGGTKDVTSTESPNLDPRAMSLRNSIIQNYLQQLQGVDFSGYQANAQENINKNAALEAQQTRERLAAHGIIGPAQELAVNNVNNNRFQQMTQLQNSIPLLRSQYMQQIAQGAGNFFSQIPFGRTITDKEKTTGTMTTPGNIAGGAVGGGASALAYLYGQGAFGGTKGANTSPLNSSNPIYHI